MATKIKPTASGSYTTITAADTTGAAAATSTGISVAVAAQALPVALEAINRWHNAGGTGEHATGAANTLAAVGLLIQEA